MRYTQSELRLVDAFALLLVGAGLLLGVLGCFELAASGSTHRVVFRREVARGARPESRAPPGAAPKAPPRSGAGRVTVERVGSLTLTPGWTYAVLGFVLVCLGAALNLGLRRVIARGGEDGDGAGNPSGEAPSARNASDVRAARAKEN